jgi:N-acetylmuramoyl-L-alanine amidase
MKANQFCVFLDAGHGGVDPKKKLPFNYTTYPSKCFQHNNSIFHGYGWFFEGVFNREVAAKIEQYLKDWGMSVINVYDPVIDVSLNKRVLKANMNAQNYEASLFLSIHGNAAGSTTARGFEVFTSIGQTKADIYATFLFNEVKEAFPKWLFRSDKIDNDPDKEANFFVLSQTSMPAVLSENGFFTNYKDAVMMFDPAFQDTLALCHARAVVDYAKTQGVMF